MNMKLKLIPVHFHHADLIYKWANEEETRKNAFHTEKITYDTHQRWMKGKLSDKNCLFYLCCKQAEYIGQVRVDLDDRNRKGIISYSIDKTYRGRGYGKEMLYLLEEIIKKDSEWRDRVDILLAKVKYENLPSQKCLEKAGYSKDKLEFYIEYKKIIEKYNGA